MTIEARKMKGELVSNCCNESFGMPTGWMAPFEEETGPQATFLL
jgi:hypothetical protein